MLSNHENECGRRRRILVVDDLAMNRDVVEAVLATDYDVDVAVDGEAGCVAALCGAYDLILMDIELPAMDGFEAAARIKAYKSDIIIAALTSTCRVGAESLSFQSGMDAFIARPVTAKSLLHRVSEILVEGCVSAKQPHKAVWKAEVFRDLAVWLGEEKMGEYLRSLSDLLSKTAASLRSGASSSGEFARQIHDLVSASGLLGFEEVSGTCLNIQAADLPSLRNAWLRALSGAVDRAVEAIDRHIQAKAPVS